MQVQRRLAAVRIDKRSPLPTPQDVAYIELAYRVSELARESGARWGMHAALDGVLADREPVVHQASGY